MRHFVDECERGTKKSKGIHGRLSAGPADPAGESPGFQARL